MIRLARHIETLLLGNECVQVPNLGGFVAHHMTARYDSDEGIFLPPLRTLGFNPQLKMNDSLLVESYAEAYDLSYSEAKGVVEDEVAEMTDILDNTGSYELNNLGRLFYDGERKLNFEPCESGILTPEFYALSSFDMPQLSATVSDDTDASPESRKPRIIFLGSEYGQRTLNISLKAIRNISVAAVLVASVFLVALPVSRGSSNLSTGNIESGFYEMFNPSHSDNKPVPTAKLQTARNVSPQKQQVAAPKPAVAVKPTADTQKAASYWSIVMCAGVPETNAEELVEKIKASGHGDAFVYKDSNVKVLYGKYSSKEDALTALRGLRSEKYFADGWLLEVDNK